MKNIALASVQAAITTGTISHDGLLYEPAKAKLTGLKWGRETTLRPIENLLMGLYAGNWGVLFTRQAVLNYYHKELHVGSFRDNHMRLIASIMAVCNDDLLTAPLPGHYRLGWGLWRAEDTVAYDVFKVDKAAFVLRAGDRFRNFNPIQIQLLLHLMPQPGERAPILNIERLAGGTFNQWDDAVRGFNTWYGEPMIHRGTKGFGFNRVSLAPFSAVSLPTIPV